METRLSRQDIIFEKVYHCLQKELLPIDIFFLSMASSAGPTAIVKELCTYISKEKDAAGNIYLIYKCPNTACKETEGKLRVKDKSGEGNIFKHLQTCLCGGQNESSKEELEKIYKEKKANSRNAITPWFTNSKGEVAYTRGTLKKKEQEVFKLIKMIVFKNWPLASV